MEERRARQVTFVDHLGEDCFEGNVGIGERFENRGSDSGEEFPRSQTCRDLGAQSMRINEATDELFQL